MTWPALAVGQLDAGDSAPSAIGTVAQPAPRIGLVLAGGGARGIAHVGVIRALEEMQIPVHAIAGTSMGALVGGLYAIGLDADQLGEVVATMDWASAFEDKLERQQIPTRRKGDDYDYPTKIDLSLQDGKLTFPLGLIQGQQVRLIIKQLMEPAYGIHDFDQLPIPYRAVATDIENGDAYVFSEGDIVTAMRASMSLPGLLAPVEHAGRLLVDGGLAMNIPVQVAQTMGVDKLIVVDIGTPLKSRDEISSVVSVADQVLGFLTRKNSLDQLKLMDANDILIRPELPEISTLGFDRFVEAEQSGYQATMAQAEILRDLALPDLRWRGYVAGRKLPEAVNPEITFIDIDNNSAVSDDIIRVRLSQALGAPLNAEQLRRDIASIYALDYFQSIDFMVARKGGQTGLRVIAREKTWGTDIFKIGLNLVTNLDGRSEINMGGSYRQKGVNHLGGEWYASAQIGDLVALGGEFYQPLDLRSRFFVSPYLGFVSRDVEAFGPEFGFGESLGHWQVRELTLDLAAGINLFANSQVQAALFGRVGQSRLSTLSNEKLLEDNFQEGGYRLSYFYDSMDNVFFPRSGGFLSGQYRRQIEALGADEEFESLSLVAQAAYSFGATDANTIVFTARAGISDDATFAPQNMYQLGGLFNLSGFGQDVLSGRQMVLAVAQYQRRLTRSKLINLDMPVYWGASLESGGLWGQRSEISGGDMLTAGSIYLAVDSPIGPLYLAYGRSELANQAVYLSLGWPFFDQGNRRR